MRHIKDIYPLVNEVRQRIIEKMRAENIVLVQFCPANEEEYLEEHKDEDSVQDYGNYRDEVCPNVVYFDKYGCGYEYVVLSVSLVGTTDPHLKLYCYAGELGSDTFMDSDVYDMTWVYEFLEKHLGLEEQKGSEHIVTLMNCSSDERDEYRLMNVTAEVLNKSKEAGGSEAMKELLRNRLDELFNGDIEEYFGEDHVTGEPNVTQVDVEDCINLLAMGEAACINGEDFWWSDEEDLITEL